MADYNINAVTRRVVFSGSAGTGPYAFTFEVLDQTDLAVYFNAVKLTLTTDYTVSVAANGTGSVTIVTGTNVPSTPVTADQITIVGARDIERTTDFVTAGDLRAAALNEQLDGQIIMVQQISEESKRAMRAPVYDPALVEDGGVVDMELPTKASRAGNYLAFDTDGNPTVGVEIGVFRGDWAASTAYALRDIVKDTTDNNIYIATTAHTSSGSLPISSNADVAKWALIVDAAAAATSATNAANSATAAATSATNAATSASNAATSEANAGTSETNAASSASAASTSATNASNSASAASTSASNASTSETNAASSASAASTSATNAASSASAASTSATNASNSASAASTSASNAATSETNAAASAASAEAAAASVYWNFDTSTTMADPGTGDVRFNNATIASVTQVAVSASSASTGNPDVSDFVAAWDDSTSTTKGYIVIREAGAPGTTIVFAISGTITDNTTWLQIPVTHVSSAGTLSASDDLYFSFSRTGDAGLGSGDLLAANNLSDVADAATARSNLSAAASGANTDITSLREVVTAATSGIVESNANFIDTCLVGPSVDRKAWSGKFENGSVWSSLMLASVETSGSDAEVNIWDLTAGALASASPLATVTLTGATPTSIAANMGYVIVGTSDQGFHIVDPHGGSWAERTDGWPYSLTASTSPALSDNNVQSVNATIAGGAPYDPRTGGSVPTFVIGLGATKDFDGIMDNGTVVAAPANTSLSNIVGVHNDFLIYESNTAGNTYYGSISYARDNASWSIAALDGSGGYPLTGTVNTIRSGAQQTLVGRSDGLISYFGSYLPGSVTASILAGNRTSEAWATAAITNSYNSGYMPGQVDASCVLAAFANSKTADRSGKSNTLTAGGTTTEITPYTGAEIKAYRISAGATNNTPTGDADFEMGTGSFSGCLWVYAEAGADSLAIMQYRNASTGAVPQWGITTSTTDLQAGVNSGSYSATATWTGGHTFIADGNPHLVGFSFNGTSKTVTLFVDGNEVASATNGSIGSVSGGASFACGIGASPEGGNEFDNTNNWLSLARITKGSVITGDQFKKMYEAEVGMFADNAKCLLQGASDAVLDARIDPLTGKYIVTQSDTQDIFDGLTIDTERTIAAGGTTFEHGVLWGDGVAEINDANLYASMPATNQRQINEMVRSMAAELPAGVDLSKAKAWAVCDSSATILASLNVESVTAAATGKYDIDFSTPFKSTGFVGIPTVGVPSQDNGSFGTAFVGAYDNITSGVPYGARVYTYDSTQTLANRYFAVAFFGELENE